MSKAARPEPEMTPERWQQIKGFLASVIRVPAEDRPKLVAKFCGGDSALRVELNSLIAAHEIAEGRALEKPIFVFTSPEVSDLPAPERLAKGTKLGDFEILSLL